jgi:hypothetical protein
MRPATREEKTSGRSGWRDALRVHRSRRGRLVRADLQPPKFLLLARSMLPLGILSVRRADPSRAAHGRGGGEPDPDDVPVVVVIASMISVVSLDRLPVRLRVIEDERGEARCGPSTTTSTISPAAGIADRDGAFDRPRR